VAVAVIESIPTPVRVPVPTPAPVRVTVPDAVLVLAAVAMPVKVVHRRSCSTSAEEITHGQQWFTFFAKLRARFASATLYRPLESLRENCPESLKQPLSADIVP